MDNSGALVSFLFTELQLVKLNKIIVSRAGTSVNMEGAVPTEQEINQPKPSKRARTSFTADQLQVNNSSHRETVSDWCGIPSEVSACFEM